MAVDYKSNVKSIERDMRALWKRMDNVDIDWGKIPYYCLDMFPYPSGIGLHMGHPLGYIAGDVNGRFMRMKGYNVLRPMGFDSFGLPAEQFAIQTGQHPEKTTSDNIDNMLRQLKTLSLGYDWSRMIATSDSSYYKWTQWIFLQLYDSFFDETEVWDDGFGNKLQGKAKPISVLREYLEAGEWDIDANGEPCPCIAQVGYSKKEIDDAIDRARLAYLDYAEVNWCPQLGTVLSNEEVTKDGKSERGNFPVEKRKMKQWMMRITKYCDRLLDVNELDWPDQTIAMQKNWIDRSEGVEVKFFGNPDITVFTTRPDTLLGVTFIAVSQDHPAYGVRLEPSEDKVGVFTGRYVIHPLTHEKVPVWVASYVIGDYGAGAVMGVPSHDHRDFDFAEKYAIDMRPAIMPDTNWLAEHTTTTDIDLEQLWIKDPRSFGDAFTGDGRMIDPLKLYFETDPLPDDLTELSARGDMDREEFATWLVSKGIGKRKNCYRLRDWLFSRQRYWGEPFPILYSEDGKVYPLDESELPLELPKQIDFAPPIDATEPVAPLAKCRDWVEVKGYIVNGKVITKNIDPAKAQKFFRETNTMPNWAGSCWYYLRYLDPTNDAKLISEEEVNYWCRDKYATVDLYIGGSEHAVLHLLYARFWHMVLFDLGHVPNPEPFLRLVHQGLITADAYLDGSNRYVDVHDVRLENDRKVAIHKKTGEKLSIIHGKMGKSYKNGIPPEEIYDRYGVDIFRLHLMYMAPVTQSRDWQSESIVGMERFCKSVCNVVSRAIDKPVAESSYMVRLKLHSIIKLITEHYQNLHYNTSIALMIEFINLVDGDVAIHDCASFLKLLAPCAPHISEYLYQYIKRTCPDLCPYPSIFLDRWPEFDQELLATRKVKIPVTVKNKFKFALEEDPSISDEELKDRIVKRLKVPNLNLYKVIIVRQDHPVIVNLLPLDL